ncbi:MAG: RnfABCDGE type electron transport complex subunit D [Euryarchaeota archaeon]|nr:MAG: Electron transport complex subunit RsxD [ANME-2 cluster archaeon]MEA1865891.1 RnfABCDGE type electron transport complex subunit D [Euryarchaeota archaeon]
MTYTISPLPHVKSRESVKSVMWGTVVALIPITLAAIYLFGLPALKIVLATVITAVVAEIIIYKAASQPVTIDDGNAVLVGLLLALLMPPGVSEHIWVPIIGAIFAIAVAKYIFGGTGTLVFHPALIGFAFLLAAWPTLMGAQSTPNLGSFSDILIETGAGRLVEASPVLVLLGGAIVLYKKYVDRRVALSATILLLLAMPIVGMSSQLPYILTGGYFLGLIFLAADPITSPVTKRGRLVYGVMLALLILIQLHFGAYFTGMCFAVLLMNVFSPFIDKNTIPKPIGGK